MLFNEKVMCGLGKGIAQTGNMDPASVERALAALHRFKALSNQARARTMYVLATAAAREAQNGAEFIRQAEMILGRRSAFSPVKKKHNFQHSASSAAIMNATGSSAISVAVRLS
jgi:hypothetical protein